MIGREDQLRHLRHRSKIVSLFGFVFFLVLLSRLYYLQINQGNKLRKYSEANRLKKEKVYAPRGLILDRYGKVIVDNRTSFDVVLVKQYYPFKKNVNQRLAKRLGIPLENLEKKLTKVKRRSSFHPQMIKSDVGKDVIAGIEMDVNGFPGVYIQPNIIRRLPYGEVSAQLLGYTGEIDPKELKKDRYKGKVHSGEFIGKSGLEYQYDSELRGVNGTGYVEVDAMGRRRSTKPGEKLFGFEAHQPAVKGNNLKLTIDIELSKVAYEALIKRNWSGSVVAMNPKTGEILAMVNSPAYFAEKISGKEIDRPYWASIATDPERPLRNRAVQDFFPPGSTFKTFLSLAGLSTGKSHINSKVTCKGFMKFGNRKFHCWKKHGKVDFLKAIQQSCDIFFYQLGNDLGVDGISKYARLFGFGERTEVNLPGEKKGLIPSTAWKKKRFNDVWHAGETLSVAIGQGYVVVTPLQLALSYAAIATSGKVQRPFVLHEVESSDGTLLTKYEPQLVREITEISSEQFELVKEGLYRVVNVPGGTAYRSKSDLTVLSGKTGTAQVRRFKDIMEHKCEKLERKQRHHGWFAGYAPRKNPEIVVAALGEHNCHGSSSGRIVKEVVEAYFSQKEAVDLHGFGRRLSNQ